MALLQRINHLNYQQRLKLILVPFTLGLVLLFLVPAAISFGLAFFRYDALSPPKWVGDINFLLVFTDELFQLSLRNSLALILLPVPLRVLSAFLFARLMLDGGRLTRWLRSLVFMPNVIPAVAFALGWLWILNPLYGPLNLVLNWVGVNPPAWFADPAWAKPALVLLSLWQVGESFLVSLAALHDLPAEIEDAARIDGASYSRFLLHVTLPMLAPILLLLSFRDAILTFQSSFTTILMTTRGGPYYATYTLPLFIYEQGFDLLSFGTASAALWVLYALAGLVVLLLYLVARQWDIRISGETFDP